MNQTGVRSVGSSAHLRTERARSSPRVAGCAMERSASTQFKAGPLAVRGSRTTCRTSAPAPTATSRSCSRTRGRRRGERAATPASSSPTTGSTTAATRSCGDGPRIDSTRGRPGDEVEVALRVRAPQPPGRYRLAFDLVEELRWFAEVGSSPLELDAEVLPRIEERRLAVVVRGAPTRRRRRRSWRRKSRSSRPAQSRPRTHHRRDPRSRTGRGGSSTRTPRATSRSAARSRRATARCARGRRAAAATGVLASAPAPVAPERRRAEQHSGLPAYVPGDEAALFDGRIRLRLPHGRRRA